MDFEGEEHGGLIFTELSNPCDSLRHRVKELAQRNLYEVS